MALLLALVATALGAPAAGADVIASSSSGYEGGPALSSDGRVIVGERRGSGARRILAIDPATRAVSEVASFGPLAEPGTYSELTAMGTGGIVTAGLSTYRPVTGHIGEEEQPTSRTRLHVRVRTASVKPPAAAAPSRTAATGSLGLSAPYGNVLWKADAESSMASEWASNSSVPVAASPPKPNPTRIAQSTFRAQGQRSYRFEMRNGDDSYGERAELGQGMPTTSAYQNRWFRPGDERWIAMQYYFPADWPSDNTWQCVFQIKPVDGGGGGPSLGFYGGANRLTFEGNNNVWGSTAANLFDGAGPLPGGSYPLVRGRWIKLTWHVVFSASPSVGSLEVFGDLADGKGMRTLVPRHPRVTMKYLNGKMDPAHLRVGIYRDPTMTATQTLYVDGVTVATTRAAAEANAYAAG